MEHYQLRADGTVPGVWPTTCSLGSGPGPCRHDGVMD